MQGRLMRDLDEDSVADAIWSPSSSAVPQRNIVASPVPPLPVTMGDCAAVALERIEPDGMPLLQFPLDQICRGPSSPKGSTTTRAGCVKGRPDLNARPQHALGWPGPRLRVRNRTRSGPTLAVLVGRLLTY